MSPNAGVRFLPSGVEFPVVVSAGSRRSGVTGMHGDAVKVAVRAAPERGKANAEVVEVIAAWFAVPVRAVEVIAGQASRRKRLGVAGIRPAEWQTRIGSI